LKDYIEERALEIASYIIMSKATVREAAKIFKVSKSTVHKDISERLPRINPSIWESIRKVLDSNKAERHIRGGRATRLKYKSGSSLHRNILKKNVDKKDFMIKSRI
jgi:putative DeoR family transcriptional regulator (stage III sporulation protein D)